MRVIGGKLRGLQFHPPHLDPTRPTTDIAKEGLFNVLNNNWNFDNVRFLDLFGGTGAHSYEFASRGCDDITIVERFPKCVKFIEQQIAQWKLNGVKVLQMDVFQFIGNCHEQYDIIFAGPPYALETLDTLPDLIFEKKMIEGQGWFILEHNPNHNFDAHPNFARKKNYGETIFSIFHNLELAEDTKED